MKPLLTILLAALLCGCGNEPETTPPAGSTEMWVGGVMKLAGEVRRLEEENAALRVEIAQLKIDIERMKFAESK